MMTRTADYKHSDETRGISEDAAPPHTGRRLSVAPTSGGAGSYAVDGNKMNKKNCKSPATLT